MARYTIVGGNGKVATRFTRLAIAQGDNITSIIRSSSQASALSQLGATPVVESIESATVEQLSHIFAGSDAIIWLAGAGGKGGAARTRQVDYHGALKVFDAAEQSNVLRFIMISAVDIRDRSKPAPKHYTDADLAMSKRMWDAIPVYMQAKYDADKELVWRSTLKWTILRPGGLVDDQGTGRIALGSTTLRQVTRDDVAETILQVLQNEKTVGLALDLMQGETPIEEAVQQAADRSISDFEG